MPYLSYGSHLKPHLSFLRIFVIDVVLMHNNGLISALPNEISQRGVKGAIMMRSRIVDDLYLQQSVIQIVDKVDEVHLVVIYALIHRYLDMHYFGKLLL